MNGVETSRSPALVEGKPGMAGSPQTASPVSVGLSKPRGSYSIDSILGHTGPVCRPPQVRPHLENHTPTSSYSLNDTGK